MTEPLLVVEGGDSDRATIGGGGRRQELVNSVTTMKSSVNDRCMILMKHLSLSIVNVKLGLFSRY